MAGGYYYYHPARHKLISTSNQLPPHFAASNQPIFDQAAFAIFLVADLDAITPMYGDLAQNFCFLEAGYMSQLLMMEAPTQQLGLCPIGGLQEAAVKETLGVGEHHVCLHSLVGGQIDPSQMTQWFQSEPSDMTGASKTWQDDLRAFLQEKLPAYMVPTIYIPLDSLPLSANGKVDRKALPVPNLDEYDARKTIVPPQTPIEEQIAEIWQEVLDYDTPSIDHDFFAMGGDSIMATRLLTRLRQTFDVDLSLQTIFANPTIAQLAGVIDAESLTTLDPALLEAALAKLMGEE
ncbi:MAG: phosphopantetheine-binding protein [Chloroflexota bacterium]